MLNILHVDRSEMFRKVMQEMVRRCGHSVRSVSCKAEALSALASESADLLVTALELDDGNAEELLRSLEAGPAKDIPVVVVTSTDSLEQRERFFALGVVDYMLKGDVSEERFRRYFDTLAAEDELSRFMRGLRVAVVDDSPVILKIVQRILALNGMERVSFFSDPLEFFEAKESFDLYIVDIVLPNMSGDQVVSRIRAERPDAIILSMSRFTGEKPLANILLAGADDYIHKPFDAPGLISRIKVNVRSFQYKKRLEQLAVTDGLTGLYNHRFVMERLEEEAAGAERYRRDLSLVMLDIDHFKKLNDTYGHRRGDEALRTAAETIKASVRASDVVGRYGGEEFLVLLPNTSLDAARAAAEKMRRAIESLRFGAEGMRTTVSAGVAEYRRGEGVEAALTRADGALYEAKRAGRNRTAG